MGYIFFYYSGNVLGNVHISEREAHSWECSIFRKGTQIPNHVNTQQSLSQSADRIITSSTES